MIAGNEAVIIKEILAIPHGALRHEIFQGSVACKGGSDVIRGKVRIILNPKGATIADDEILVTSMTRPEFVSLMRKAKAVITDEGGITSHAAIVSREMNKPCVIGTKFATKLLKDGDTVEMKMNHGAIRIL
jgi:pyruvate,water dikinase